jgi:Domain of unknown function (DUF4129)
MITQVVIGGDEAREAAQRELTDPVYAPDTPGPIERGIRWVLERLGDLLQTASDASPGGAGGLLVIAAAVLALVVVVRLRMGRVARTTRGAPELFGTATLTAADHRAAADAHARRGEWAEAVRERLRAVVRGLEERDLLDVRAGRTADEAAAEAGRVLPACADRLTAAARVFDDVWYGGRPADAAMDTQLRAVDEAVRSARPTRAASR